MKVKVLRRLAGEDAGWTVTIQGATSREKTLWFPMVRLLGLST